MRILKTFDPAQSFDQELAASLETLDNLPTPVTPEDATKTVDSVKALLREHRQRLRQNYRQIYERALQLKELISSELDNQESPYAYAVETYSTGNLEDLDFVTREQVKKILRDYFANSGLSYDGWSN